MVQPINQPTNLRRGDMVHWYFHIFSVSSPSPPPTPGPPSILSCLKSIFAIIFVLKNAPGFDTFEMSSFWQIKNIEETPHTFINSTRLQCPPSSVAATVCAVNQFPKFHFQIRLLHRTGSWREGKVIIPLNWLIESRLKPSVGENQSSRTLQASEHLSKHHQLVCYSSIRSPRKRKPTCFEILFYQMHWNGIAGYD